MIHPDRTDLESIARYLAVFYAERAAKAARLSATGAGGWAGAHWEEFTDQAERLLQRTTAVAAPDLFTDVGAFHAKFGLAHAADRGGPPSPLDPSALSYRIAFMIEELAEFCDSQGGSDTAAQLREVETVVKEFAPGVVPLSGLADGADALADLVYVALGTAHLMRLPFDAIWAEVQRANMAKERATGADDPRSKRAHSLDVVKPAGWTAPDHWPALYAAAVETF